MLWKLLYGLIIIGISKYGDHIEECPRGNYACPSYCDIDHKHHPRKECKNAIRKRNIRKESGQAAKESQKNEKEKIEEYNNGSNKESRSS